jgi:hypothetical protein
MRVTSGLSLAVCPTCRFPLSTLRHVPRDACRMTRGQSDSPLLLRIELSSTIFHRLCSRTKRRTAARTATSHRADSGGASALGRCTEQVFRGVYVIFVGQPTHIGQPRTLPLPALARQTPSAQLPLCWETAKRHHGGRLFLPAWVYSRCLLARSVPTIHGSTMRLRRGNADHVAAVLVAHRHHDHALTRQPTLEKRALDSSGPSQRPRWQGISKRPHPRGQRR